MAVNGQAAFSSEIKSRCLAAGLVRGDQGGRPSARYISKTASDSALSNAREWKLFAIHLKNDKTISQTDETVNSHSSLVLIAVSGRVK